METIAADLDADDMTRLVNARLPDYLRVQVLHMGERYTRVIFAFQWFQRDNAQNYLDGKLFGPSPLSRLS